MDQPADLPTNALRRLRERISAPTVEPDHVDVPVTDGVVAAEWDTPTPTEDKEAAAADLRNVIRQLVRRS